MRYTISVRGQVRVVLAAEYVLDPDRADAVTEAVADMLAREAGLVGPEDADDDAWHVAGVDPPGPWGPLPRECVDVADDLRRECVPGRRVKVLGPGRRGGAGDR